MIIFTLINKKNVFTNLNKIEQQSSVIELWKNGPAQDVLSLVRLCQPELN